MVTVRRDYAPTAEVCCAFRFLRPGALTPPYRSRAYSLVQELLDQSVPTMLYYVDLIARYQERLLELATYPDPTKAPEDRPAFGGEFSHWDACALYASIRAFRPSRIVEIGSGGSSRWMRQAIRDADIECQVTSVDPGANGAIYGTGPDEIWLDHYEDVWHRTPNLQCNDILFYDGSHLIVPDSDLIVLCLEAIPRLPPGVLIHFHDIFPPDDVPGDMRTWMQMESYLVYTLMVYGNFELLYASWPLRAGGPFGDEATQGLSFPAGTIEQTGGSVWLRTLAEPFLPTEYEEGAI